MAAPKGSQYAVGYGRPPKFEETESELERMNNLIGDYFDWIQGESKEVEVKIKDKEGNVHNEKQTQWVRKPEPPTVTGLTFHLGFCNKSTLYDYAKNGYFSNLIKRALTLIEKHHEINVAYGDKCTGNIFVLKNMGWKDTTDLTNNGGTFEERPRLRFRHKTKNEQ